MPTTIDARRAKVGDLLPPTLADRRRGGVIDDALIGGPTL